MGQRLTTEWCDMVSGTTCRPRFLPVALPWRVAEVFEIHRGVVSRVGGIAVVLCREFEHLGGEALHCFGIYLCTIHKDGTVVAVDLDFDGGARGEQCAMDLAKTD